MEEEEAPCRRRRGGDEVGRQVSVMLVRPWGDSRVNDGMVLCLCVCVALRLFVCFVLLPWAGLESKVEEFKVQDANFTCRCRY